MIVRAVITVLCGVGLYTSLSCFARASAPREERFAGLASSNRLGLTSSACLFLARLALLPRRGGYRLVRPLPARCGRPALGGLLRCRHVGRPGLFTAFCYAPRVPVLLDLARNQLGAPGPVRLVIRAGRIESRHLIW